MADLFTSLVAVSPNQSKTSGNAIVRVPGLSPQVKDGIWNERACAPAGDSPALGHLLDANTVALWRFNVIGSGPSGVIPDETGNYPLTNTGGYWDTGLGQNGVAPRASQIGFGAYRGAYGSTGSLPLLSAAAPAAVTALSGEMTAEFWVAQFGINFTQGTIISFANGTQAVFEIVLPNSGNIEVLWNGAGNVNVSSSSYFGDGASWAHRNFSWAHVAVRRRFTGGLWLLDFFTNGAFRTTIKRTGGGGGVPLWAPGPFIGAPYTFRLTGGAINIGNDVFQGILDDVRISKVARTDAEILDSYHRGFADGFIPVEGNGTGHILDANTLGMWRLDETSSASAALDSSTNALSLPAKTGTAFPHGNLINPRPKPGRIGGARESAKTNGFNALPAGAPGANIVAALVAGNVDGAGYTYEAWVWWNGNDGLTQNGHLFAVHEEVTGFGQNDSGPRYSRLFIRVDSLILHEEWGSAWDGSFLTVTSSPNTGWTIPHDGWNHIALVHRAVGGSVFIDRFLNGGSKTTSGPHAKMAAVGASPSTGLNVGLGYLHYNPTIFSGGTTGNISFNGYIDDFRFSNVIRSDAEILESYNRGKEVPRVAAVVPLTSELSGYWNLNTNSNDSLGLSNGTDVAVTHLIGDAKLGAGGGGFNGTTSGVVLPSTNLMPPAHLSVSAWVKTTASGYREILSIMNETATVYSGFELRKDNSNTLALYLYSGVNQVYGSAIATGTLLTTGAWTHVAATYDGTYIRLYINGVANTVALWTGGLGYGIGVNARIGVNAGLIDSLYWLGSIDEVGLWSRALSQADITALYNGGVGLSYPF